MTAPGFTLDTGALIALERRHDRGVRLLRWAVDPTTVDAIVMASAARRGDVVLTSDVADLERLARHFKSVRVLSV